MNKQLPKKLLFVVHPFAADKLFATFENSYNDFCENNDVACIRYNTTGEGDLLKLREIYYHEKPDRIVAVGGDGTVNLCANVVVGTKTPLAIIPTGSTNGLAKELNIPMTTVTALNLIIKGIVKTIDTLKINDKNSFHISDLGFNARILKRVSKSSWKGRISYFLFGLNEFFQYKPQKFEVATTENYFKGKALMIIITNSRGFGYNLKVNPLGIIDDGVFEICIIRKFPPLHVFKMLYRVYSKTLHKSRYAKILKATQATIRNLKSGEIHIDGEPFETDDVITVTINPASLNVIVPF